MVASTEITIPGKGSRPFDIGNFVLRRFWYIVLLGGALFALLVPVAIFLSKPYFKSGGRLLVRQNVKMFLDRSERVIQGDFRDFLATKSETLRSVGVAEAALRALPRQQWPDFIRNVPSVDLAARLLVAKITVDAVGRSHLLGVNMIAGQGEGMAETINAIMESFIQAQEREQELDSERRLSFLYQEMEKVLDEMSGAEEERKSISGELTHSSFSEDKNPAFEILVSAQRQYMEAQADLLRRSTEQTEAERNQNILGGMDMKVFAEEQVASNEAVYLIDNWTYQKLQELRSGIDGLTETNEDRIDVEKRMNAMTDYLTTFKSDLYQNTLNILQEKRGFELESDVIRAKSRVDAAQELTSRMDGELAKASKLFARSSEMINRGITLNETLRILRERRSNLEDRIREVKLEAKAPIHVSIEQRAEPPAGPDGDNLGKLLAASLMGALGLVGSAFLGYELLDGRIASVKELRAALGAIPADPVPLWFHGQNEELMENCVREFPEHPCSKAVRLLAARLEDERSGSGAKVFLLSGVERGCGASWLSRNLAEAMTHYADRMLVVEVKAGATERAAWDSTVLQDPDRYLEEMILAFFRSGERVSRIILQPDSPLVQWRWMLTDFLQRAKGLYDGIILDVPPLLDNDLSRFLAKHSEVAVLVPRESQSHYSSLRKSVEILVRLEIPALTGVLNGCTAQPLEQMLALKTVWVEERIPQTLEALKSRVKNLGRRALRGPGVQRLPASVWDDDNEQGGVEE